MKKRVFVSVTNDLSTDQRVHKTCMSLNEIGFEVMLVGQKHHNSVLVDRPYNTLRFNVWIERGPLFYLEYNIRLFFVLFFNKNDILLSNDLDTLLANYICSKLKRIPLIYDSHELFPEAPELVNSPIKKGIWQSLESFFLPRVVASFTVCESIASYYFKKYGVKMNVLRNVPSSSKETSVEKDKNVILYQGNLNPGRGLELAIATMAFLPEFKLKIIGGGHEMSRLKELAEKLDVSSQIEFLGRVKFQNLKTHTDRAIIGLLLEEPLGLSFEYSLPNKLFDYIHSNTIVLASPLIEVKKIISKYPVGEILKNRNPKKMAQQIRDMISNSTNFQFSNAKRDLNWQKESLVFQKVFSPYSTVKK